MQELKFDKGKLTNLLTDELSPVLNEIDLEQRRADTRGDAFDDQKPKKCTYNMTMIYVNVTNAVFANSYCYGDQPEITLSEMTKQIYSAIDNEVINIISYNNGKGTTAFNMYVQDGILHYSVVSQNNPHYAWGIKEANDLRKKGFLVNFDGINLWISVNGQDFDSVVVKVVKNSANLGHIYNVEQVDSDGTARPVVIFDPHTSRVLGEIINTLTGYLQADYSKDNE